MSESPSNGLTGAAAAATARRPSRHAGVARKIALGAAALFAVYELGGSAAGYLPRFAEWVESLGLWAPIAFMLGYAVATVAFVPGLILTMAAGAIFGLARGTLFVFIGATAGATAAFLIARHLARAAIERRLEDRPRFGAIDRAIGREGLKVTFLLRLSPVFPFNLLNYALGLTRVRTRDFVLACLGILPGTFLYAYLGSAIGNIAAIAAGERGESDGARLALLVLGLAATVVVTVLVTRSARRALAREVEESDDE